MRGPPATTVMWIPEMRPRRSSGTVAWRIVDRNTAEITSAPPATARHAKGEEEPVADESPKAAIETPQIVIATMIASP